MFNPTDVIYLAPYANLVKHFILRISTTNQKGSATGDRNATNGAKVQQAKSRKIVILIIYVREFIRHLS